VEQRPPNGPNPETVRRFRGLLEDSLNRLLANAAALDAKAWQALGVGSIVLGLGVAGELHGWWLVAPLILYGVLVVAVFVAVRVRGWKTTPAGGELWERAWHLEPDGFERTVVAALVNGEPHNRKELRRKALAVWVVLGALVAEIVALAIAAVFA
jgi:hypothetical protein